MQIEIRLEGTTALICNKFTDSAAQAASSGTRTSSSAVDRGTAHEVRSSILRCSTSFPRLSQDVKMPATHRRAHLRAGYWQILGKVCSANVQEMESVYAPVCD